MQPTPLKRPPISAYCLFLALYQSAHYLFRVSHNAFHWPSTQDIPFLMRILDPSFLPGDFYTNALAHSPKYVFAYIIYGLSQLGIDWYDALYFLKVLINIIRPCLFFILAIHVIKAFSPKNLSNNQKLFLEAVALIFALGLLDWIQGNYYNRAPAGWGAMLYRPFITSGALAFVPGMLYLIALLSEKKSACYLQIPLLLITTAIHPFIGLSTLAIGIILILPILPLSKSISKILLHGAIAVGIPIGLKLIFYKTPTTLTAEEFIYQYIHVRHAHHYLMSTVLGKSFIYWTFTFSCLFGYSVLIWNRKLIVFSLLCLLSFVGAIGLQYVGTEVLNIKKIAELGPARFTTFASFILGIEILVLIAHTPLAQFLSIIDTIFANKYIRKLVTPAIIVLILATWQITLKHPLDYYRGGNTKPIIEFIQEKTPEDSVFFIREMDPFLVRIYGKRAIFADMSFPFHESYMDEFTQRLFIKNEAQNYTIEDYKKLKDTRKLDYLIIPEKEKAALGDSTPVFETQNWAIYEI